MDQEIKQLLQNIENRMKKIEDNQVSPLHIHNGNDSSKVNIGDLNLLAYGNMYSNTATTITVSVADTWYEITSNQITGLVKGSLFVSHYLEVGITGKYFLSFSMALKTATANQEVAGGIMINGVISDKTHGHSAVIASAKSVTTSANTILNLSARDQVSLAVENHTLNTNIVVDHSQLSIFRIA